MVKEWESIRLFVFDLDGTIYKGNQIIPFAKDCLDLLAQRGHKVCFLTNNSSVPPQSIIHKLEAMGIDCTGRAVYSPFSGIMDCVKRNNLSQVFCIGSEQLKQALQANSVTLTTPEQSTEAIIVAMDVRFNLEILSDTLTVSDNNPNCLLIAGNKDRSFPTETGRKPGCGPFLAAVEYALDRSTDILIGKPSDYLLQQIAEDYGSNADEMMVIGDTLASDIAAANQFGCKSYLVETDCEDLYQKLNIS